MRLEHTDKRNICLGRNFRHNIRFKSIFWVNSYPNDFWLCDEKSNEWCFYNTQSEAFHLYRYGEPKNISKGKQIRPECFSILKKHLQEKNKEEKILIKSLQNDPFHKQERMCETPPACETCLDDLLVGVNDDIWEQNWCK